MKSAIEEHGLERTVCHWWKRANASNQTAASVINWLHGAGEILAFPNEAAADELFFLSQILFEKGCCHDNH